MELLDRSGAAYPAAGVGAFLGEYLRMRGKNLATTADFERLQKQLSANTKLVETIKAEVGQKDWAVRQWANVRQVKLEELVNKVYDCEAYTKQIYQCAIRGEAAPTERDFAGELKTFTTIYFPELEDEVSAYLIQFHGLMLANLNLAQDLLKIGTDMSARTARIEVYKCAYRSRYSEIEQARSKLGMAVRKLIVQIMGVSGEI